MAEKPKRLDIQALRGLAVLAVLLYHARIFPIQSGFLGVDIFFVISGFLITGIIRDARDGAGFSFAQFYFRRAKRILPAAYVTFLATSLLFALVLSSTDMRDLAQQVLGGVTFTANFVLQDQTNYFDTAAELKPLLHVWSLSIEEQFYLVFPLFLLLVPRRHWLIGAGILTLASLGACLWYAHINTTWIFYQLPFRAWELALGAFGALLAPTTYERLKPALRVVVWPAVVVLMAIPFAPLAGPDPGLNALIACLATLVIILANSPGLNRSQVIVPFAKVGDFSYSLYLVHWPLIAFISNAFQQEVSTGVRLIALALSFALAYALYRLVELPIWKSDIRLTWRSAIVTLTASAIVVATPFVIVALQPAHERFAEMRRINYGFAEACEFRTDFSFKPECENSAGPKMLVWGDSYAMHLIPGLAQAENVGIAQATKSVCGPLLGLAPSDDKKQTRAWAQSCMAFNQSVIDALAQTPSVKVVVLASPFSQFLKQQSDPSAFPNFHAAGDEVTLQASTVANAAAALRRTIDALHAIGKRVVVIAPPPYAGFDIGMCLERKASGKLLLGPRSDCRIPLADYRELNRDIAAFLARVEAEANVPVVGFDETLCGAASCETEEGGVFLYRDSGHFSVDGSKLIAARMNLAQLLMSRAR